MRRFVLRTEPDAEPEPTPLQLDYAAALNPQQLAAATAGAGPVLVVAGAGTGKTRTLVYRVAYLIERGTPPEGIALLTFTRRAARQMIERASSLLDGRCRRVRGGTFHAFCLGLLRRHADRLGFPRTFTILDSADAADVLDLVRTRGGFHRAQRRFPKKRTLLAMISASANRALPLAAVLEEGWPQFLPDLDAIESLQDAYRHYKREHGLMDYDDLLGRAVELLEMHEGVRRQTGAALRHVLVDEYQDTNATQARLVELFASVHGNVTAVGDDAQSIYRFRGADVANILRFPEAFPGTQVLKLEENYRSTQPILDLANHIIQGAHGYDKALFTNREGGERPALVHAQDEAWQSRFVTQVVLDKREAGTGLDRMAVLFRSGWNSYDLEVELDRRRIPYVKYGGLKLAEAAHVKDVVAHLRVVENPGDAAAWNRVLRLLEGVGPKTAESLLDWIAGAEDPVALDVPFASGAWVEGLKRLAGTLAALRREAEDGDALPLPEQIDRLVAYYLPILERVYQDDFPNRQPDLEALVGLAQGYPRRTQFLEALALDPVDLTSEPAEGIDKDEPPLVLSTIHSAKGLEFDTVFLIDALDGVIPNQYALKTQAETDEERRLLYVAVTRAENELYLSYPTVQHRRRAGGFFTNPSRFLQDVPEALLEAWSLVREDEAPQLPPASVPETPETPPALPPAPPRPPDDGLPF